MQNIESILREFGLEIPAEKMAAFQARFRENYKTVKEVSKLEAARDQWKAKAEAADGALQDAQSAFDAAIAQRDFDDALNAALAGYKFTSEAAKRDVAGQVRAAGPPSWTKRRRCCAWKWPGLPGRFPTAGPARRP